MALLKFLLQLFSLDSAERRIKTSEKRLFVFKCAILVVVIGGVDAFCLFWKAKNIFKTINPSIVATDVIQMLYDYVQYIVDLFFIYKYGRECSQEYLKNYEYIDKILDNTHQKNIDKRFSKLTIILLSSWSIVSAFDFTAWYLGYGILTPIFYGLAYIFLMFKILTNLDLTVQVFNVECRLGAIGDLLLDCYNSSHCLSTVTFMKDSTTDVISNKHWFYEKEYTKAQGMKTRIHPVQISSSKYVQETKWLPKCYLLLSEQCSFINKMFGFRVLLNSLSLLIDMVRFLNVVVRVSLGYLITVYQSDSGYLPAISTFMRFLMCVLILASLVYHCECAYAQSDRIINIIDHIVINKNPESNLKSNLLELRSLAISRPITFNMANFFRLSYPFLVSTISVVVSYTIILLQSA